MGALGDPQPAVAWRRASILGAELGAATGLVVACVDSVSALRGGFAGSRSGFVLYVFALTVAMTCAAGIVLGLWSCAARRLAARASGLRAAWVISAFDAVPIAAVALYAPTAWIAAHAQELELRGRLTAALVLLALTSCALLAAFAARWIVARFARPSRFRRYAGAALFAGAVAVAAGCYTADATLYPDDYAEFHDALAAGFVAAVAICAALLRAACRDRPAAARLVRRMSLASAAVLAASLVLLEQTRVDAFGASRALVFTKLVARGRLLSDLDGDGFAAVLGGRDCAAFDAQRSPAQSEVPENGTDEDCSGVDERWPIAPPRPRPPANGAARYNVLFITVDALRADHLGTYGYARRTSPHIDRFAGDAVVFLRAFSQASKTWDSVPSFLTGVYPSNLPRDYGHRRVRKKGNFAYYLKKDVGLVAEAFAARGYATSAIVSGTLLGAMGLDRGFAKFERNRRPTRVAKEWLARAREPFMMWLHYDSPHAPYKKRRGHDFGGAAIDRYDGEIAFDDGEIGVLLGKLAARGLADSTVVILSADHGEEFGEHGGFFHTRKHYRELLHVPLIVRIPGVAPARVRDVVELVDIVPTLHELCDLPPARARFDGQSLLPTLRASRPAELAGAYAEDVHRDLQVSRRAFFDGRYRLIDDRLYDRQELYDTRSDPTEQRDLAGSQPEIVQRLRERIAVRSLRGRSPRR